jgi:hypothetical protein
MELRLCVVNPWARRERVEPVTAAAEERTRGGRVRRRTTGGRGCRVMS